MAGVHRSVLDKIVSGEYKKRRIQIGFYERKRKWFVTFPYEPEKVDRGLNSEKIVGLALGAKYTFYAVVSGSKGQLYAEGSEVIEFRRKIEKAQKTIARCAVQRKKRPRPKNPL